MEVRAFWAIADSQCSVLPFGAAVGPWPCAVAAWLWVTLREGSRTKLGPAPAP